MLKVKVFVPNIRKTEKAFHSNLERDLEVLPRAASALPNTVELTVNLVGKILSMMLVVVLHD